MKGKQLSFKWKFSMLVVIASALLTLGCAVKEPIPYHILVADSDQVVFFFHEERATDSEIDNAADIYCSDLNKKPVFMTEYQSLEDDGWFFAEYECRRY